VVRDLVQAASHVSGSLVTAVCWNEEAARLARLHNDANMISLGERMISDELAIRCVDVWMTTAFEGGRHVARVQKLDAFE
jgi:ribose 5-phosphate isomerase B